MNFPLEKIAKLAARWRASTGPVHAPRINRKMKIVM
jgi:hypothetical protein